MPTDRLGEGQAGPSAESLAKAREICILIRLGAVTHEASKCDACVRVALALEKAVRNTTAVAEVAENRAAERLRRVSALESLLRASEAALAQEQERYRQDSIGWVRRAERDQAALAEAQSRLSASRLNVEAATERAVTAEAALAEARDALGPWLKDREIGDAIRQLRQAQMTDTDNAVKAETALAIMTKERGEAVMARHIAETSKALAIGERDKAIRLFTAARAEATKAVERCRPYMTHDIGCDTVVHDSSCSCGMVEVAAIRAPHQPEPEKPCPNCDFLPFHLRRDPSSPPPPSEEPR